MFRFFFTLINDRIINQSKETFKKFPAEVLKLVYCTFSITNIIYDVYIYRIHFIFTQVNFYVFLSFFLEITIFKFLKSDHSSPKKSALEFQRLIHNCMNMTR